MDHPIKVENIIEVPEDVLKEFSKLYDPNNKWINVCLEKGAEIKLFDLTPMYLMDTRTYTIFVVISESFGKKLH